MNYAIILASGKGKRAGGDYPKQFIEINGRTILEYTVEKFQQNKNTDKIIIVTNKEYIDMCKKLKYGKILLVLQGGAQRQDSSFIGVDAINDDNSNVIIHDGARPFVTDEIINEVYKGLETFDAVNCAVEITDTLIKIDNDGTISEIPNRNDFLRCQTPQGFKTALIKRAHKLAKEKNMKVTDDCSLIVKLSLGKVFVVKGSTENIKITYPEDIETAKRKLENICLF